ncbi:MAG: hypothetical protein KBD07_04705 [Candidatus Omnitrophica bacterium]|jgi:hypothetical protein|nr:hypothetical protein [Candidatus Omnitrophota bacterium]
MKQPSRAIVIWALAAFTAGASGAWALQSGWIPGHRSGMHGLEPRSGFVILEADRRKSRAYLNFMYGLLYQERGQRHEAAERFAEACALDRVLQPSFESDQNPS